MGSVGLIDIGGTDDTVLDADKPRDTDFVEGCLVQLISISKQQACYIA